MRPTRHSRPSAGFPGVGGIINEIEVITAGIDG